MELLLTSQPYWESKDAMGSDLSDMSTPTHTQFQVRIPPCPRQVCLFVALQEMKYSSRCSLLPWDSWEDSLLWV